MSDRAFRPFGVLRALTEHRVRFILIGGLAGRARGSPSITNDVDVCYAREAANLQAMARTLRALNAKPRGAPDGIPFVPDAKSLYEGDRFTFATDAGALDIMGAPDGVPGGYAELDRSATDIDMGDGMVVRVTALEDLMRMKRAAGRPKDLIELEVLGSLRDAIDDATAERRADHRPEPNG